MNYVRFIEFLKKSAYDEDLDSTILLTSPTT